MRIVLFCNWYKCSDAKHQEEIDLALEKNLGLDVDRVVTVVQDKDFEELHERWDTHIEIVKHRHTFNDIFELAVKEPRETICCTANADVYWDKTIENISKLDLWGKFLCLTRHNNGVLNLQPQGSQDSWVWLSQCTPRTFSETLELGRYGVDGKLNFHLLSDGYALENPCNTVHVHHLHAEGKFDSPHRFPAYEYPLGFVAPPNRRGQNKAWIENVPGERGDRLPTVRTRQVVGADGKLSIESW